MYSTNITLSIISLKNIYVLVQKIANIVLELSEYKKYIRFLFQMNFGDAGHEITQCCHLMILVSFFLSTFSPTALLCGVVATVSLASGSRRKCSIDCRG
jgi:hypothetical protein